MEMSMLHRGNVMSACKGHVIDDVGYDGCCKRTVHINVMLLNEIETLDCSFIRNGNCYWFLESKT